jgi:hypothetical protein
MLNIKRTTVYNNNKKIKTFDNVEDAESFKNAVSILLGEDDEIDETGKTGINICIKINEFEKMYKKH